MATLIGYFRSSFCGGRNAVSSGHGSPLVKCIRDPPISLTRHVSRAVLSVVSIKTEGLTPIKYISGMTMGETVTFVGVVRGEGQC